MPSHDPVEQAMTSPTRATPLNNGKPVFIGAKATGEIVT
jgi:hypothetical protein